MPTLYPLQFAPTFRRYIWGGRRLGTALGKPIGDGDDYAESWEVVDHGDDQSVVAGGPLAGMTLARLVCDHGQELFGRHHPQRQFPLLFKFLDCNRNLSVQVHPDDAMGAQLDPPDNGKTEAWVILDAAPGSTVYAGLRAGVNRQMLEEAVEQGTTETCLARFEPQPGDCVFVRARTVHALGEGLLVAEIQQASDTTYRLFDWNRTGPDGKPRQLHVAESLETIDYTTGPVGPQTPQPTDRPHVERLVDCDKFVLDRWRFSDSQMLGGDDRFHIIAVLDGEVQLRAGQGSAPVDLQAGQTLLLPAAVGAVELRPSDAATLLDIYLP